MIVQTKRMLFVTDKEISNESIEVLISEHNTLNYKITIDRTLHPPYYQFFHWWKDKGRALHDILYASSKLDKIRSLINNNVN